MRGLPCGTRRGFSMVELAVVLVVIGALAAIAVPRLGASGTHARLEAAGREVASILMAVRDEARASSTTIAVRFDPVGGALRASVVDPNSQAAVALSATELAAATDEMANNDAAIPRLSATSSDTSRKAAFVRLQETIGRVPRSTVTTSHIVTQLPDGVRIVSANLGGDDAIIFRGHGEPDSGGAVVLGLGGARLTVTVNAGDGSVTMRRTQ